MLPVMLPGGQKPNLTGSWALAETTSNIGCRAHILGLLVGLLVTNERQRTSLAENSTS
jgi:hypothetical protein